MRLLIDLQGTQSLSMGRGIGRYTRAFTLAFLDLALERGHRVELLLNASLPLPPEPFMDQMRSILGEEAEIYFHTISPSSGLDASNDSRRRLSEAMRSELIAAISPDLVLISSLFEGGVDESVVTIPEGEHPPTAVIFYDLIPLIYPDRFLADPNMKRWYYEKLSSLRRADLLLAISRSAAQEAREYLGWPEERVVAIGSATDAGFDPSRADPSVGGKWGIDRPYLMHAGAWEERKNFEGLVRAFGRLPRELKRSRQLLLVCDPDDDSRCRLEALARKSGLTSGALIVTGRCSDEELVGLYAGAELFVYPSLHEGFGLPPLEAMACGTPAIGSDRSSIPEVLGRDDLLFDPEDPDAIAAKVAELLRTPGRLEELRSHARAQAARFSWRRSAQTALDAMERLAGGESTGSIKKSDAFAEVLLPKIASSLGGDSRQLLHAAEALVANERSLLVRRIRQREETALRWRIEGPFDSSYSLALVNRELARALRYRGWKVALHSTEGPGDYEPDAAYLKRNPDLAQMREVASLPPSSFAVQTRNLYPPRAGGMEGFLRGFHQYAWEEGEFPFEWVEAFNASLDFLTVTSRHVKKVLHDSGVRIPLFVVGNGVDHWERIEADLDYEVPGEGFRFLHISSCFPRKGVDVLFGAYGDAFTSEDPVTLVVKTFPNPHNEWRRWLREAKAGREESYPRVVVIEEDLDDTRIKALYAACDALVAPSRAEGFGLPMAEAMLSELPVITTDWGGQRDFCDEETAWMVDYRFTRAGSHFSLFDSVWAEPRREDLSRVMREIYENTDEERRVRIVRAKKRIASRWKWDDVAHRSEKALSALARPLSERPALGWITTWGVRCGIADYCRHLRDGAQLGGTIFAAAHPDAPPREEGEVLRCWDPGDGQSLAELSAALDKCGVDTLVIQFNYSLFDFVELEGFLREQHAAGRTLVMILHSTHDAPETPHKRLADLVPVLSLCDRLLVHGIRDLNRLKDLGLVENVVLWPHGIPEAPATERPWGIHTPLRLMSYGFALPHKGLEELLRTAALLRDRGVDFRLEMLHARYPVPESEALLSGLRHSIRSLGLEAQVRLIDDYLDEAECLRRLARADLILFPYQHTGESSSAAVRYALAAGRPVAVTPLEIFEDLGLAVQRLEGADPEALARGIARLVALLAEDGEEAQSWRRDASAWASSHRWSRISHRLRGLLEALHRDAKERKVTKRTHPLDIF